MHVDSIQYTLLGEENEFVEETSEVVNMSLQVTTFYYEREV